MHCASRRQVVDDVREATVLAAAHVQPQHQLAQRAAVQLAQSAVSPSAAPLQLGPARPVRRRRSRHSQASLSSIMLPPTPRGCSLVWERKRCHHFPPPLSSAPLCNLEERHSTPSGFCSPQAELRSGAWTRQRRTCQLLCGKAAQLTKCKINSIK